MSSICCNVEKGHVEHMCAAKNQIRFTCCVLGFEPQFWVNSGMQEKNEGEKIAGLTCLPISKTIALTKGSKFRIEIQTLSLWF